jgi:hypothetical protein
MHNPILKLGCHWPHGPIREPSFTSFYFFSSRNSSFGIWKSNTEAFWNL